MVESFEDLPYFYQIPHCLVRAYSFDQGPLPSSGFSLMRSTSYSLDFNLKTAATFHLPHYVIFAHTAEEMESKS